MILKQSSSHSEEQTQFLSGLFFFILKEVTNTYFRVCIRDNAGYDGQRSNVIVDYLVIGGNYGSSFISWSKESSSYSGEVGDVTHCKMCQPQNY